MQTLELSGEGKSSAAVSRRVLPPGPERRKSPRALTAHPDESDDYCTEGGSTALALEPSDGIIDDGLAAEEINIVVAHIKRLARNANLEFALRVGALIIHHFYDGDANAWRRRGPKVASFRRLAAHPDLPLSPGTLYRCVALYELCDRLDAPSRWTHLGASHLRLVLGLPSAAQERLLATANAKRWSVKVLHQQVVLTKAERQTRGGRRAQSPVAKSIISLKKCIADHRDAIELTDKPTKRDLVQTMALVEEASSCLENLTKYLEGALKETEGDD
ncbi:MAG TPA: hypothetical protein VMG12_03440 [Polyangiaceae bacterium]|nr:hypothetical protein [Polyangiaceae bacterium]